jgi:hypothetical protein
MYTQLVKVWIMTWEHPVNMPHRYVTMEKALPPDGLPVKTPA